QVLLTLPIFNDVLPDPNETFSATLGSPTGGATLGATTSATVTIVDDDSSLILANPSPVANDGFGFAVAKVALDIAVGEPFALSGGAVNGGVVHVFDAFSGSLVQTFANPTPANGDAFGSALASAGTDLIIGAPGLTSSSLNG